MVSLVPNYNIVYALTPYDKNRKNLSRDINGPYISEPLPGPISGYTPARQEFM
jgi:hypothetical protein